MRLCNGNRKSNRDYKYSSDIQSRMEKMGSNWKINMHKFPFQFVHIPNIGYKTIKPPNNRHQSESFSWVHFENGDRI